MKITTRLAACLAVSCVLISMGCKKSQDAVKTSPAQQPVCEPVRVFSTPNNVTYIVIMHDAGSQHGNVQTLGTSTNAVTTVLNRYGITQNQRIATLNYIHSGFIARLSEAQALALKKDQGVDVVEPDRVFKLDKGCYELVSPSTAQWGVRRTGSDDGTGKRVWIIDTGVDTDHPDLDVDTVLSKCFIRDETSIEDNNGHGTHVAGIIGALNNSFGVVGVAAGAKIIALKALDNEGSGSTSQLIRALNYVGQNANPGEVVNMSLGSDTISASLDNAVLTLAQRGILFAIAAGNESQKADLSSPARVNDPNVFTVSAIDSVGRLAGFSNYGNDVVDFAAPGVRIVSTYSEGRYARLSGTSMAAPHVAGILVVKGKAVNSSGVALDDNDGVADPIASY